MKVLIVGAGSVGTVLAAYLAQAGHALTLYLRAQRLREAEQAKELRVEMASGAAPLVVPRPALTERLDLAGIDLLFLCVKHTTLEETLAQLPPALPAGLVLVPCLNGVGYVPRLRARFPGTEVAQLTIMFNARITGPLAACLTTRAEVHFNTTDSRLLGLFGASGMLVRQVDEAGQWGKLLINLNNAVCGVTHTTFKDLLTQPMMTRCFVKVLDEAIATLGLAGIRYTLPVPVPYGVYRWVLLHGGPLAWWIAKFKNGLTDQAYPSMAADLVAGRPTEIEQLNGEIVRLAQAHGRPAPANGKLIELVHAIEQQRPPRYLSAQALATELGAASP